MASGGKSSSSSSSSSLLSNSSSCGKRVTSHLSLECDKDVATRGLPGGMHAC